ncbi:CsbD family protein [Bordetella bronchialis]|uniref:CsbD-like domain-containing protein n=1 Tax=Bordetella bronchialis TaxID=463025 RepID=A0A193FJ57_9BORD|nr:CsbD family protein [Bordetella bronchialis]ANN67144.1 hypothetical protein BAU06_13335 [Bordetella bronchialis]ANN72230.1 hypothetical protein BAU08_13560 [Bordetella bronchialis]
MLEKTEGTAEKWAGKAQDAIGEMTGDTGTQIKGKARELTGRAQESYGDALNMVRDCATNNPLATVAVAVGAGLLLGALLSSRR